MSIADGEKLMDSDARDDATAETVELVATIAAAEA